LRRNKELGVELLLEIVLSSDRPHAVITKQAMDFVTSRDESDFTHCGAIVVRLPVPLPQVPVEVIGLPLSLHY
jgi:hypothetical protein